MSCNETRLVLVVEDDPSVADTLRTVVESEPGYQAVIAEYGQKALALLRRQQFCLVLLDVYLPDVNGIDIFDAIQRDPTLRKIPVLFVTAAVGDPAFDSRSFKNVLAKPFDISRLLDRVQEMCPTAA